MSARRNLLGMGAAFVVSFASVAQAATDIALWHAMGGELGEKLNQIAEGFNKQQTDYKVIAIFKGTYSETLTQAIAAFRASSIRRSSRCSRSAPRR